MKSSGKESNRDSKEHLSAALEIKQFPNKMEARRLDVTLFTTHRVIKEEFSGVLGPHSAVKLLSGLALLP